MAVVRSSLGAAATKPTRKVKQVDSFIFLSLFKIAKLSRALGVQKMSVQEVSVQVVSVQVMSVQVMMFEALERVKLKISEG